MRLNEHTALISSKLLLVPYCAHHVPTYHEWMQDPDLQQATASEPLTIDEEYAMQRSWREDADKLTFIICAAPEIMPPDLTSIAPHQLDSDEKMIGDINLFLVDADNEDDTENQGENAGVASSEVYHIIGEIELMIARKEYRRQGNGRVALQIFLQYILNKQSEILAEYRAGKPIGGELRLDHLRVKINERNLASLALFESMAFRRVTEHANYFGELELRVSLADEQFLHALKFDPPPIPLTYGPHG